MAEAGCPFCAAAGYRSCDECGGPVFKPVAGAVRDLCGYCLEGPEGLATVRRLTKPRD